MEGRTEAGLRIEQLGEHDSLATATSIRASFPERSVVAHVARYPADWTLRVHSLDPARELGHWGREHGFAEVLSGGFFTKPSRRALGYLQVAGTIVEHEPFHAPWHERRGALAIDAGGVATFGALESLDAAGHRDVLQAGPMLVRGGVVVVADQDPEGFSSTCQEFDSDITAEPLPRVAIGHTGSEILAVAVDGRSDESEGLLLPELAQLLVTLGAVEALNLDGGASATLVTAGQVRNLPRGAHNDPPFPEGYPTCSAITFAPPH